MTSFLFGIAVLLMLNLGLGLIRVARGPTPGDRMVAAQLFGTHGVATLLVLATATDTPALRDVALVFAVLAVVMSVAFVKRGWVRKARDGDGGEGGVGSEPETAGTPEGAR